MRRYKSLILLALLLVLSGTASAATDATTHACNNCHQSPAPSAGDLKQPLSRLCIDCHTAHLTTGEHAVDIPVQDTTIALPTQGGNITCSTCHDHHDPTATLRLPDPDLCRICHKR